MIDLSHLCSEAESMKKKDILSKHKIWQDKCTGYWKTYIPDENGKRQQRSRKDKHELENLVIDYYLEHANDPPVVVVRPKTFKQCWKGYMEYHKVEISDNTVFKYETDYKRYFLNSSIESMKVRDINKEDMIVFLVDKIKALSLPKRSARQLFNYANNVFDHALTHHYIDYNPMMQLKCRQFYKHCVERKKTTESRTVSDEDMHKILNQLHKDHEKNERMMPPYAVELAMYTGMRVGEIAGLRWDHVKDDYLIVDCYETFNRAKKQYEIIPHTKNYEDRKVPINKPIRDLLDRVKDVQTRWAFPREFVFSNRSGRIHTHLISSCIKNKCIQLGIPHKSIHALRRTLSSKMKCAGVPTPVVCAILGHSESVNEEYYTYDVSSWSVKENAMDLANSHLA